MTTPTVTAIRMIMRTGTAMDMTTTTTMATIILTIMAIRMTIITIPIRMPTIRTGPGRWKRGRAEA